MEKTIDYGIFKKHEANRVVDAGKLRKLVSSIKAKNLLEYRPILVNKQMEVIDGQHRLEAAKELQVAIYYNVEAKLGVPDMIRLNANQSAWTTEDYAHAWAKEGNINYIKLLEFSKKQQKSLRLCFKVLVHPRTKEFYNRFKNGTYKFPPLEEIEIAERNIEHAQEVMDFIKTKTANEYPRLFTATFQMYLIVFLTHPLVCFATFKNKLSYKLDLIRPCPIGNQYLEMFRKIYNWKNSRPIDFYEHMNEDVEEQA